MNQINGVGSKGSNKLFYIVIIVLILIIIGYFMRDKLGFTSNGSSSNVSMVTNDSSKNLPENWPSDVPFYANAKITGGGTSYVGSKIAGSSTLTTPDSQKMVIDFYKKELPSKGWTILPEMNSRRVVATQDSRELMVTTYEVTTGGSMISVIIK